MYEPDILGCFRALSFKKHGLYWFGRRVSRWVLPEEASDAEVLQQTRQLQLQRCLYENFYSSGGARPPIAGWLQAGTESDSAFIRDLENAVQSMQHVEDWTVSGRTKDGGFKISRNGLTARSPRLDHTISEPGALGAPAAAVRVRVPALLTGRSPGFAVASAGQAPFRRPTVRIYWHLRAWLAPHFLSLICRELRDADISFSVKVGDHPHRYTRCDAAVLYVSALDLNRLGEVVADTYWHFAAFMPARVPIFTLPVAPGLGLAVDPGNGESFGMHRCGLLAAALAPHMKEKHDRRLWLQAVDTAFKEAGVSLTAPYESREAALGTGVASQFASLVQRPKSRFFLAATPVPLDLSVELGLRIAREAIWAGDRCNWVEQEARTRTTTSRTSALGAEIYDGTAGIALFLAELFSATGHKVFAKTAWGAIANSIAALGDCDSGGFYLGRTGIAWAAQRVGKLTVRPELEAEGVAIALLSEVKVSKRWGIVDGIAGDALALVALAKESGNESLAKKGTNLGGVLRSLVEDRRSSESTKLGAGYAHGSAGIASALLEVATLEPNASKTRDVVQNLLLGLNRYFLPAENSWRDTRFPARAQYHSQDWCNGAGGIVLSLTHASRKLENDEYSVMSETGVAELVQCVSFRTSTNQEDHTICHGYPGMTDVLMTAATNDPATISEARRDLFQRVVRDSSEAFSRATHWRSSLMTGAAGAGMLALRVSGHGSSPVALGLDL